MKKIKPTKVITIQHSIIDDNQGPDLTLAFNMAQKQAEEHIRENYLNQHYTLKHTSTTYKREHESYKYIYRFNLYVDNYRGRHV